MAVLTWFCSSARKMSSNFASSRAIPVQLLMLSAAALAKQTSALSCSPLVTRQILSTVLEPPAVLFHCVILHLPRHEKISQAFCSFLTLVTQNADLLTPTVPPEVFSLFQCLSLPEGVRGFLKWPRSSSWRESLTGWGHLLISREDASPGSTSSLPWISAFPKGNTSGRERHICFYMLLAYGFLLEVIALVALSPYWILWREQLIP